MTLLRAPPARRQPDRGRADAGGPRRGHPRAAGVRRGGARSDRRPARGQAADGLVPDGRRDADAAGDRHLPRAPPRRRADAGRGRARADRAAAARRRARPRAAVRVRGDDRGAARTSSRAWSCSRIRCTWRCPASTSWPRSASSAWRTCARKPGCRPRSASPCARHVVRSCHAAGFEPNVAFESDDYQTVQGLVAAGVGVALIPELALTRSCARTSRSAPSPPPAGAPGDRGDARGRAPAAGGPGDARPMLDAGGRARADEAPALAPGAA